MAGPFEPGVESSGGAFDFLGLGNTTPAGTSTSASGGFLQNLIGGASKAAGSLAPLAGPAGLAIGGAQLVGSLFQGAAGRKETPGEADPGQLALLEELKQRAKSARTGSQFGTERALVEQTGAATRRSIARASGGSSNETLNALLRSQGAQNSALNQVISGAAGRERFFTGLGVNEQNRVSQRRFDVQMFNALRKQASAAQLGREGFGNVLGALFTQPQTT